MDTAFIGESCVPDLDKPLTELGYLQDFLGCGSDVVKAPLEDNASLALPSLDEYEIRNQTARMAFPTLFPNGMASLHDSRFRAVGFSAYIKHLLYYKDGRFARHPQFRYWAFNTLMRSQANRSATWLTKQLPSENISLAELREMAKRDDQYLADNIVRAGASLRGTRPYWNKAQRELEAMVLSFGSPSLFFTLSAADMHWRDLYRHAPPSLRVEYEEASTESARAKVASRFLQDNPHIAAEYLDIRFRIFFQEVIKKRFKIGDHWIRFEWQGRGSGHIHGFLWIEGAPSIDLEEEFLDFWAANVVALNPDASLPPASVHPSSRPFADQYNSMLQLTECLNRYQRHPNCSPTYCQKQRKGAPAGDLVCRFHFPIEHSDEPSLGNKLNSKHRMFEPIRNDSYMCKYIPLFTMAWNANHDGSPCGHLESVIAYLSKHGAKAEKESEKLVDVTRALLSTIKPETASPFRSLATKLLNRTLVERDWPASEICHILLDLPLRRSSRTVVSLDLRRVEDRKRVILKDLTAPGGNEIKLSVTMIEKYCRRPVDQKDLTLYQAVRDHAWDSYRREFVPVKARAVNLFPKYKAHKSPEEFCRAKLMLHHPFLGLEMDELYTVDGVKYETFTEAFESCYRRHTHDRDPLGEHSLFVQDDSDLESLASDEKESIKVEGYEDFVDQRKPGPDGKVDEFETELGRRPKDRNHDWLRRTYDIDVQATMKSLANLCKDNRIVDPVPNSLKEAGDPDQLNARQREVFDKLINAFNFNLLGEQLLIHLDGVAGTGKSRVIELISRHLTYYASEKGYSDPGNTVLRAASTGVAAHNISGSTLHSLLKLPINRALGPLQGEQLTLAQKLLRSNWLLIIDEKSMLGGRFLSNIDLRLREILNPSVPFGGHNVLLCGDFGQLPPVMDTAMYSDRCLLAGKVAYAAFNRTIVLEELMRQQGQTEQDCLFRETLDQLRSGPISVNNWQFLVSRTRDRLSFEEWRSFDDAVRLYHTRAEVHAYNTNRLVSLQIPVMRVEADSIGKGAAQVSEQDAGGLASTLFLARGARVMISRNICTEKGLVNGVMGTVHSIIWDDAVEDAFNSIPDIVMVKIDGYTGIACVDVDGEKLVPVSPAMSQFEIDGKNCHRTQLPLRLAFAITIHKSQGLTLPRVVIALSSTKVKTVLAYVALSRVRAATHFIIEEPFPYSAFPSAIEPEVQIRINDGFSRQGLHHLIRPITKAKKEIVGKVRSRKRTDGLEE